MAKKVATVAKHTDYPTGGCRRVYNLSKPAQTLVTQMLHKKPRRRLLVPCVCADFETTPDRGPETMVFACTETGSIINYQDLVCMPGDHARDDEAVRSLGIEVWDER